MNCKPGLCTSLLTFLQMEQSLSVQYLLTALINTLVKQTEQFLLVLDDYHVVTESAVHTSLIFLLEHLPSQLHIVEWVQFWLASGEVERVIGWAQELVQQPGEQSPLAREREDVARARILLAQKKPAEALSLLGPLHASAEQQERWNHVIEMKVLQALAHSMCDEEQEALAVLAQAMQLAEPEGYIRIFVDEGAPMASMLSRLREQEDKRVPTAYLDTLLATFHEIGTAYEQKPERAGQRMTAQSLLNPLTKRELGVLQLIARGSSNPEIAKELVLALDTVKRHVYNIFAKLGVKNRMQAVARARALGLIADES